MTPFHGYHLIREDVATCVEFFSLFVFSYFFCKSHGLNHFQKVLAASDQIKKRNNKGTDLLNEHIRLMK